MLLIILNKNIGLGVNLMTLEDFRTSVALLTQHQLAEISGVAASTIQYIEAGNRCSKLTRGKILSGLSKHLGRTVKAGEIDEFSNQAF
jgi:DNA-binding XRE family transcriptional regulator